MSRRKSRKAIPSPYKSWYEYFVSQELDKMQVTYQYEPSQFTYYPTINKGLCLDCSSKNVSRAAIYTPDWYFPDQGFYIETKGILSSSERKKLKTVKDQLNLDLKIMLEDDGKIRNSKKWSRYSDWCEWADFDYTVGKLPKKEWFLCYQ